MAKARGKVLAKERQVMPDPRQLELELKLGSAGSAGPLEDVLGRKPKGWLWALLLALLPVGAIAWQMGVPPGVETEASEPELQGRVLPVSVVTVEAQAGYGIQREYAGELVARRTSRLGYNAAVTVEKMKTVHEDLELAGQVFARLDDRSL